MQQRTVRLLIFLSVNNVFIAIMVAVSVSVTNMFNMILNLSEFSKTQCTLKLDFMIKWWPTVNKLISELSLLK